MFKLNSFYPLVEQNPLIASARDHLTLPEKSVSDMKLFVIFA